MLRLLPTREPFFHQRISAGGTVVPRRLKFSPEKTPLIRIGFFHAGGATDLLSLRGQQETDRMKNELHPQDDKETIMKRNLPIMAVLDTDTYNEVDDQFALAYALLARDAVDLQAVVAAPFSNERAATPEEGMRKSYEEIGRILALFEKDPAGFAWKGSTGYLPARRTPVESEGARRIIELAHIARSRGCKLHVLAIAAITNVASALLLDPEIAQDIVIVWLGGNDLRFPRTGEFNLRQDVFAAQVIFDTDVPLVWMPCRNVVSILDITLPELRSGLAPAGELGEFLYSRSEELIAARKISSKIIWDISTVAYFSVPQAFRSETISSPVLNDDRSWGTASGRHTITAVVSLDRDAVFADLFRKLSAFGGKRENR